MAPNEIILADADELLRIQSARSVYRKDDWYQIGQMNPPHHNLLSMQDKEARRERKRKVMPGVSFPPVFSFSFPTRCYLVDDDTRACRNHFFFSFFFSEMKLTIFTNYGHAVYRKRRR